MVFFCFGIADISVNEDSKESNINKGGCTMKDDNAVFQFEKYLKDGGLKYRQEENGSYTGVIQFSKNNSRGYVRFIITFESGCICNVAYYPAYRVSTSKTLLSLRVMEVNRKILWGGFDLEEATGALSYKLVFPYRLIGEGQDLVQVFDDVLYIPCAMGSAYLDEIVGHLDDAMKNA